MPEVYKIGPAHVFYGDPTQAAGAGMLYLGKTRGETLVALNVNVSVGKTDQDGMTPLASTVFNSGPAPVITIPFVDEEKAKLVKQIVGSALVTNGSNTALVFGAQPKKIALADIGTLVLIPVDEIASGTNGIDAPNAFWFPRAIANDVGQFTFNLPDGDDNLNPHTVGFIALQHPTDQDGTPNAIPVDARAGFRGSPNSFTALATQWSLPVVPTS